MDNWWKWYCSLFPSRRYEEVDPYLWQCQCGYKWRFSKIQLLHMYLTGEYIHKCPQCQRKSRYRMITHVVHELDTDEIKEHNRCLE